MKLYRLTDPEYAAPDDLRDHAQGSLLVSGRWHSLGRMHATGGLLYTSVSVALASIEKQLHISADQIRQHEFALITYEATLDPALTFAVTAADLPAGWQDPLGCAACAQTGSDWYGARSGVFLIVPSVSLPATVYDPDPPCDMRHGNVLINTSHPQAPQLMRKVGVQPFRYDQRLAPPSERD